MFGFDRDQVIVVCTMFFAQVVMGIRGIPLAIETLGGLVFAIVTVLSMGMLGFAATHGTNKALSRIVGKDKFANMDFATSIEMDAIRGTVYLGLQMLLYFTAWLAIPKIPAKLREEFSWLSGFASAGNETLTFLMLVIALLLIVIMGVYHLNLQKAQLREQLKKRKEASK